MDYLLALDQGTSSSRALAISTTGKVVASAQKEIPQNFPTPGWVEQDPKILLDTQIQVIRDVLQKMGKPPLGIGISNQRETTVVWEKESGNPIYPAIVWQDRRSAPFCQQIKNRGFDGVIQQKTGLLIDPYFSATKIRWILQTIPGAYERAKRGEILFGTIDTWLIWNLSGQKLHITDATNASRTLLFNIHQGSWDQDLLDLFDIPKPMLPTVKSSAELYGATSIPSLPTIQICGVAGDLQAALIGQGCFQEGSIKGTYGTGGFLLMNTGIKPITSKHKLLTTIAYKIGNTTHYALEGSIFVAGGVVQWLRDQLGIIPSSDAVEALAASVPSSEGTFFVPSFTGLGAPHWNPYAKAALVGMSRGTTKAHIARAALEGIAFQFYDLVRCMELDSNLSIQEMRVDGGACKNNLLMQFQSDLLQIPILRPKERELSAIGASYLAGAALGIFPTVTSTTPLWEEEKKFIPTQPKERMGELVRKWDLAVRSTANLEI